MWLRSRVCFLGVLLGRHGNCLGLVSFMLLRILSHTWLRIVAVQEHVSLLIYLVLYQIRWILWRVLLFRSLVCFEKSLPVFICGYWTYDKRFDWISSFILIFHRRSLSIGWARIRWYKASLAIKYTRCVIDFHSLDSIVHFIFVQIITHFVAVELQRLTWALGASLTFWLVWLRTLIWWVPQGLVR